MDCSGFRVVRIPNRFELLIFFHAVGCYLGYLNGVKENWKYLSLRPSH